MIWLWTLTITVYVVLGAMNLYFGELNQDEGWYLYAARMVSQGKLPYIDFASTQGPVMPFVYVLAQPLVRLSGVAGGRLFTALLGLIGVVITSLLAARLVPPQKKNLAALLAFSLAGINVYQSYFSTIVKTYSLCGLFIVSGFLVLTFANGKRAWIMAGVSGVLLALAAGTRISAGVVLPVVFVVLFFAVIQVRRWQDAIDSNGTRAIIGDAAAATISPFIWFWFAVGAVLTVLIIFPPFAFKAPAALWFALVEYHAGRYPGSFVALLAYKAGFISRLVQAYFVPVMLMVSAVLYMLFNRNLRNIRSLFSVVGEAPFSRTIVISIWCSVAAVTLVHFSAPFPYEDYQVIIFPLFAVALAVMLSEISGDEKESVPQVSTGKTETWISVAVLLLCIASSFASPVNQGWFTGQRDRIWWPLRKETPLNTLQRAAGIVQSMTKSDDILLTQDLYLAVEAGLNVPKGLELGPFSYFPFWSTKKAKACHVLNREMMLDLLNTVDAPVAAFSGYGLSIGAPAVVELSKTEKELLWKIVARRYTPSMEISDFGQADTTLRILKLKSGDAGTER